MAEKGSGVLKTLYVVELYGAFFDSEGKISKYDLDALKKLRKDGMEIAVATDRSFFDYSGMNRNINDFVFYRNPKDSIRWQTLMLNGAWQMHRPPFQFSETSQYAIAEVFDIYGIKGELNAIKALCSTYIPCIWKNHDLSDKMEAGADTMKECLEIAKQQNPHIIAYTATVTYEELLPLKNIAKKLEDVHFTFYEEAVTKKYRICIYPKWASRKVIIDYWRERMGYDKVVCITDRMYDLSMFEAADVKVAMGNADEETKALADKVIDTNDRGGLVKFLLEEYINNNL